MNPADNPSATISKNQYAKSTIALRTTVLCTILLGMTRRGIGRRSSALLMRGWHPHFRNDAAANTPLLSDRSHRFDAPGAASGAVHARRLVLRAQARRFPSACGGQRRRPRPSLAMVCRMRQRSRRSSRRCGVSRPCGARLRTCRRRFSAPSAITRERWEYLRKRPSHGVNAGRVVRLSNRMDSPRSFGIIVPARIASSSIATSSAVMKNTDARRRR